MNAATIPLPPTVAFARPEPTMEHLQQADFGTDLDASLRFAESVCDRLRYCPGIGWLSWDGRRWLGGEAASSRAMEEAKKVARRWTTDAAKGDDAGRSERIKRALALEAANHVRAASDLAKSDPRARLSSRVDASRLVNCAPS